MIFKKYLNIHVTLANLASYLYQTKSMLSRKKNLIIILDRLISLIFYRNQFNIMLLLLLLFFCNDERRRKVGFESWIQYSILIHPACHVMNKFSIFFFFIFVWQICEWNGVEKSPSFSIRAITFTFQKWHSSKLEINWKIF